MKDFVDLQWSSSTGEYFAIEYSPNLANGFFCLKSNLLATSPINTVSYKKPAYTQQKKKPKPINSSIAIP
jgi:hypothetical protein